MLGSHLDERRDQLLASASEAVRGCASKTKNVRRRRLPKPCAAACWPESSNTATATAMTERRR
jgi:hypothetical protein